MHLVCIIICMEITFDPAKNATNRRKHNIDLADRVNSCAMNMILAKRGVDR